MTGKKGRVRPPTGVRPPEAEQCSAYAETTQIASPDPAELAKLSVGSMLVVELHKNAQKVVATNARDRGFAPGERPQPSAPIKTSMRSKRPVDELCCYELTEWCVEAWDRLLRWPQRGDRAPACAHQRHFLGLMPAGV